MTRAVSLRSAQNFQPTTLYEALVTLVNALNNHVVPHQVEKTANYSLSLSDHVVRVDATAGAVTITPLPADQCDGHIWIILKTDASANAVIIDPNAAETIAGAATVSITTRYGAVAIQSNGTGFELLYGSALAHMLGKILHAQLPAGSGTWDYGSGLLTLSGDLEVAGDTEVVALLATGLATLTASLYLPSTEPQIVLYDNSAIGAGKGGEVFFRHVNTTPAPINYASVKGEAFDGTPGAEVGDLAIRTMRAGTLTDAVRVKGSGAVVIGSSAPDAVAQLDVVSTTKGILFPRMTTAQRDAISSPPDGLAIYNTTIPALQCRVGGAWASL